MTERLFENFENLVLRSRFVRNGVSKGAVFKEKSSILRDGATRLLRMRIFQPVSDTHGAAFIFCANGASPARAPQVAARNRQ
ncbi:MAG: hypothetical protein BGN84_12325 [Afipia sp. 62-7]|nr:MAG: hypothetical protein BGN84_12325 [Afipia sp. 62-7]